MACIRDFSRLAFVLILSTLVFSCEEDTPEEVNTSINIISPAVSELLKETIVVKAEVIQSGFSHAEIFIGDVLISESTERTIEISYDTKQLVNGVQQLKIVATDKKGNAVFVSIQVEILNL